MAWLAIDKHGCETISNVKPRRDKFVNIWVVNAFNPFEEEQLIELPKGSIKKLIGKELNWKDEPVELKGE